MNIFPYTLKPADHRTHILPIFRLLGPSMPLSPWPPAWLSWRLGGGGQSTHSPPPLAVTYAYLGKIITPWWGMIKPAECCLLSDTRASSDSHGCLRSIGPKGSDKTSFWTFGDIGNKRPSGCLEISEHRVLAPWENLIFHLFASIYVSNFIGPPGGGVSTPWSFRGMLTPLTPPPLPIFFSYYRAERFSSMGQKRCVKLQFLFDFFRWLVCLKSPWIRSP